MRRRFCPNRIFEHRSSQNLHTGLKVSSKRKNSALSIKIVQNAPFRSCAARFGQIAFLSIKAFKIVTLASNSFQNGKQCAFHKNCTKRLFHVSAARFRRIAFSSIKVLKIGKLASKSLQNGKTVRFPWKLDKTLFSGHAPHLLAKSHFWASKFLKSSNWPEIVLKTGKQCAFHENCTKRSFQVMRSLFWPNRILERQSCQNSSLVLNSLQNGKTMRFSWKLYKTLFSGHAQHVLAKSHFWASKFSKSSNWPEIVLKTGKQFAFHEKCTKRPFQVMRSTPIRENNRLSMKIVQTVLFRPCGGRFGQIAFLNLPDPKIALPDWNSRQ